MTGCDTNNGGFSQSATVTEEDKAAFLADLQVTDEQIAKIEKTPQRSKKWKQYRSGRLTGSNFGAAAGHNEHCSVEKLLKNMLWPEDFTNSAIENGIDLEDHAFALTQVHLNIEYRKLGYENVWLEDTGLLVCKKHPWLGASSDGKFFATGHPTKEDVVGTIEIKVPSNQKFYPYTRHYYYDQFMGAAAILRVRVIKFVIYTPTMTELNHFDFNKTYWKKELFPALQDFYMNKYIHRAIWKQRGLLKEGEIDLTPVITVNMPLTKTKKTCTTHRRSKKLLAQEKLIRDALEQKNVKSQN